MMSVSPALFNSLAMLVYVCVVVVVAVPTIYIPFSIYEIGTQSQENAVRVTSTVESCVAAFVSLSVCVLLVWRKVFKESLVARVIFILNMSATCTNLLVIITAYAPDGAGCRFVAFVLIYFSQVLTLSLANFAVVLVEIGVRLTPQEQLRGFEKSMLLWCFLLPLIVPSVFVGLGMLGKANTTSCGLNGQHSNFNTVAHYGFAFASVAFLLVGILLVVYKLIRSSQKFRNAQIASKNNRLSARLMVVLVIFTAVLIINCSMQISMWSLSVVSFNVRAFVTIYSPLGNLLYACASALIVFPSCFSRNQHAVEDRNNDNKENKA